VEVPESGKPGNRTQINLEGHPVPAGIAFSNDGKRAYSDSITFLDTETLSAREIKVPAWPVGMLGSQPTDAVFAADGKTLYVTCGGGNAVAVMKRDGLGWGLVGALPSVEGSLPSGWFPSSIAIDRAGALRIINIKGVGNTANREGTFNSKEYEGSLSTMPSPTPDRIEAGTRAVEAANQPRFTPSGGVENLESLAIQHVFLIIKENRTYDQVFGDIPEGNGDPKLVMYGKKITPNHHALAERYVLLDNFYASGAISFDGHHWLIQAFVSDYVERAFAASPRGYAWNMGDALTVSPTGFFWQGAPRPLDLRIYGEFSLPAKWDAATRSVVDIDEGDGPIKV